MLATDKKLLEAVEMLEGMPDSDLKQVRALQCFEGSMCKMFLHRYEACSASFQKVRTTLHLVHATSCGLIL